MTRMVLAGDQTSIDQRKKMRNLCRKRVRVLTPTTMLRQGLPPFFTRPPTQAICRARHFPAKDSDEKLVLNRLFALIS